MSSQRANERAGGPPASLADPERATLYAVAEGRASWRRAYAIKPLANELHLSLGGAYRKMDTTEAFVRWLMANRPAESAAWLASMAAEAASLISRETGQLD